MVMVNDDEFRKIKEDAGIRQLSNQKLVEMIWKKAHMDLFRQIEDKYKVKKPVGINEMGFEGLPEYMISIMPSEWEELKKENGMKNMV